MTKMKGAGMAKTFKYVVCLPYRREHTKRKAHNQCFPSHTQALPVLVCFQESWIATLPEAGESPQRWGAFEWLHFFTSVTGCATRKKYLAILCMWCNVRCQFHFQMKSVTPQQLFICRSLPCTFVLAPAGSAVKRESVFVRLTSVSLDLQAVQTWVSVV